MTRTVLVTGGGGYLGSVPITDTMKAPLYAGAYG